MPVRLFTSANFSESGLQVRVPILYYHRVQENISPQKGISPKIFVAQMEYLRKKNYRTVDLEDLAGFFLAGRPLPPRPLIISFDDGYLDNFQRAYPILKRFGFRAIFFLVSAYIGQRSEWEGCMGENVVPLMTRENILTMMADGFRFGGHGRTHKKLIATSEEEARDEVQQSKKELEDLLQKEVRSFAYPFGDYNDRVVDIVREAGYTTARTVHADNTHRREDLLQLKCLPINELTSTYKFLYHLSSIYHIETVWHERRKRNKFR
jgi:peptidoglycan/xylan/chitin deacetylase (PgdA/CDA1 family)